MALAVVSCSGAGQFVWYSKLPRTEWGANKGDYVINIGDGVQIRVYQQDELSMSGKIRRDGRLAMPLLGEIMVAGKRPADLARELEGRLKQFIVNPHVTVNIDQSEPVKVSTIGEVENIGNLTLEPPAGLIQAVSQAGGPNEFADRSRIFVLRQFPKFQRIRFTYEAILNNQDGAATFPLRSGDVVVFE